MNVQFKLNLPTNGWDYIPLPKQLTTSPNELPTDSYELIVTVKIPWIPGFVSTLTNYLPYTGGYIPTQPNKVVEEPNNNPEPDLASEPLSGIPRTVPEEDPFVTECRRWIEAGQFALCEDGVGGTYFIKNSSGTTVAVFKPKDEEPGAPNNPKDVIQDPLLPPGGGYLREIAAYLLDRHFAGVPETRLLSEVHHKRFATEGAKTGSLQRFIKNDGVSSDMGSSIFPVDSVHRVGVLDLRIFNMDRNGENLLVKKSNNNNNNNGGSGNNGSNNGVGLIPIDHTYSLPPITSLDSAFFEWHYWPQAKKAFSQDTLDFIRSIDIESDALLLHELGIDEPSILTMIVTTLLLKEAAEAGWTLFELANFVSRNLASPEKKSGLEDLIGVAFRDGGVGGVEDVGGFLVSYKAKLRGLFSS